MRVATAKIVHSYKAALIISLTDLILLSPFVLYWKQWTQVPGQFCYLPGPWWRLIQLAWSHVTERVHFADLQSQDWFLEDFVSDHKSTIRPSAPAVYLKIELHYWLQSAWLSSRLSFPNAYFSNVYKRRNIKIRINISNQKFKQTVLIKFAHCHWPF